MLLAKFILLALSLVMAAACSNRERESRYANFRSRFAEVAKGMPVTDLVPKVGEPDLRRAVFPGGPCSKFATATETLTYELREPGGRSQQQYSVAMAFIVCVDEKHKVVGTSFVEF
jgi:hypothetical protein